MAPRRTVEDLNPQILNRYNDKIESQSIYSALRNQVSHHADGIAIVADGQPALTYGALLQQIDETARRLMSLQLHRNDRVAIVLPNGPVMATAFLAVASVVTSAPLNPAFRSSEFDFYLTDLNAKALLTQADLDSPAREIAKARNIPIIELIPETQTAAGAFLLRATEQTPVTSVEFAQPEDIALMLHTSGTTSRPKLVPLTHANVCASAQNIINTLALSENDRCLNVMPLFHIHGLIAAVLSSLFAGGSVVCASGFQTASFFQWLAAFRPTWYTAVPTMHQAILAHAENRINDDDHRHAVINTSLRFIRSSSASLPPQVMLALEDIFQSPVIEAYGMTEAAHQMTSNPLPPAPRKPGSVGIAAGPEVAICDEAGQHMPVGAAGEIVIRGANIMPGYANNAAANQSAFTNGWFRTGDQGVLDADGYLTIIGRIKEMLNRGGEKIAPREIDEVFLGHPDVIQAVAFAVPHRTLGEDLAVAVVLRDKATVSAQELRMFAAERLTDYKVPGQVIIVDAIPKGPTGKLQRIGLAEKLAADLKVVYHPPSNSFETALVDIWARVLPPQTELIGIFDNFFRLGGDSLMATQVMSRVQAEFAVNLSLRVLFEDPTIAGLAERIQNARHGVQDTKPSPIVPLKRDASMRREL